MKQERQAIDGEKILANKMETEDTPKKIHKAANHSERLAVMYCDEE